MPSFFSDGNTPNRNDTTWKILQKILGQTIANGGGTPAVAQALYGGSVEPNGFQTAVGPSLYIQDDGAGNLVALWSKPDGVGGNTGWV